MKKILEQKQINISDKTRIILSLDVNGPLTSIEGVALKPFDGIYNKLRQLKEKGVVILLNSGWDVKTLELVDKHYLGSISDGFIGEHGRTFRLKNGEYTSIAGELTDEKRLGLFRKNIEACSKMNINFAFQKNLTNMPFYYDSERQLREYIGRNEEINIQEVYKDFLLETQDVKIDGNRIILAENDDSFSVIFDVISKKYLMIGIEPKIENGKIILAFNPKDKNLELRELSPLAENVASSPWIVDRINDDFCVEYIHSDFQDDVHKGTGLKEAVKSLLNGNTEDVVIFGIGDSSGDLKMKEAGELTVVFSGLAGTSAENGADFVSESGFEFLDNIYKFVLESNFYDKS